MRFQYENVLYGLIFCQILKHVWILTVLKYINIFHNSTDTILNYKGKLLILTVMAVNDSIV